LDLTKPIEVLHEQIDKDARANIRRSEKRGVIVEQITTQSEMDVFYELLQKTYTRLRAPLADRSLFENIYRILITKGMAQIVFAKVEGKIISGYLMLLYHGQIYGWYCGDDVEYRKYCPNDIIMWYIIRWGHEQGYKTLDFGWAGRADESSTVRNFKAKYCGELVHYGRHLKVYSPLLMKTIKTVNPIRKKLFKR
jgi:lipid II:glycine glycyltransferase (peptidoglycan interpeptide bridge formation enzyme)